MSTTDTPAEHEPAAVAAPPSNQAGSAPPPAADYQRSAAASMIIGEQLCETADLRAGWQVLDVATGTGNAALAAARRCCDVVGVDLAIEGLPRARQRSDAEGLNVGMAAGDALALPFADAAFDAVLSTLGVMFARDAETAADELARVCRPGGTVALANWTPDGWSAAVFEVLARHCPALDSGPARQAGLFRWGREDGIRQLFGDRLASLEARPRTFYARHHSPQTYWQQARQISPVLRACLAEVDAATGAAIEHETLILIEAFNRSGDDSVVLAHDYLEVVATLG